MLDELRRLFLEALRFDGDDAMPLVEKWNFAVKRVQEIFDGMTDKSSVQYIADKLAAYEDTGLSPEEIKLNMDGLDEYHKAEAEGRLVVLPCKVGDMVFYCSRYAGRVGLLLAGKTATAADQL